VRRATTALFVAGVLSVAAALGATGCAEPYEEAVCPAEGTDLTYDNFGKRFLEHNCNGCHSAGADERRGAPEGIDFDDLDEVHEWIDHIYDRAAGDNDSMPPGPDDPPIEERDQLAEWLACGAP
jgi:uncharacterized membrane protein